MTWASAWRCGALALGLAILAAPRATGADSGCEGVRGVFATMPRRNIVIEGDQGPVRLRVRVANTVSRRTAALRCATRESLTEAPVLLDYEGDLTMSAPLAPVAASVDVAFIKEDGRVIAIVPARDGGGAVSPPVGTFRYVLEVPGGLFATKGIREGVARGVLR
jgi:uncharacterized membrane protein (UPF0127 family)